MGDTGLSFLSNRDWPALIGMIHVGALPGTPRAEKTVDDLARTAVDEARLLADGGVDAIMLENMHDVPYLNRTVGPEIVASMTAICCAVREAGGLPLGVQVLAGANREAIAVAHAAGCQFVRCEGFVYSHIADEGLMPEADAGPLLRYRKMIGAERVAVIADVKKKHASHAITADVDLAATAKAAVFFRADAVVVTGAETGASARPDDVETVKNSVELPVMVGSGVTPENVGAFAANADAFIVGSYLKHGGCWTHAPDPNRVSAMVSAIRSL